YQKMEERRLTMTGLARALGISRSTLYQKVKGISYFRMDESAIISRELKLNEEESYFIFVRGYFQEVV
ncbi:MAG: helix-turn-helix transcriptional regulator, partial [Peptococcaceae bacterium]|nr:helix-turn-helix transcriptional regulator [Peptococcaceae bacterium]